jgi:FixJ family two-component response regulator
MNRITTMRPGQKSSTAVAVPVVFVVDDDISVREALESLIGDAGWRAEVLACAHEFLARPRARGPSCLLLDVGLPDLNGLELQKRICDERPEMPIIFITGSGDIPTTVRAMKAGAIEFLTKPLDPDVLLEAIERALAHSRASLDEQRRVQFMRERYQSLSPREREVMELVIRGRLNKQVGAQLGISEITVKAHRGRLMRKMCAGSLPELVDLASILGLHTPGET